MSIRYLGTIRFCYVRFVIGASLVVVSRLRTYGAAAKLRASCVCAHRTVLLVGCWYQGLWSWSIVELHWCVIFRKPFPWNNFYVVCQVIKQHLSSVLDQTGIPLPCMVSFPLILVVTTYTSSLYILCVKVKPWSFLMLKNSWLTLKMEIDSPASEMQELFTLFELIHVFSNQVDNSSCIKKWMNNLTKWISTQKHDQLLVWVNSQPLAYRWYWEDMPNVKSGSTSWFWLTCNCPMNEGWV
jgi:hypothetical protein